MIRMIAIVVCLGVLGVAAPANPLHLYFSTSNSVANVPGEFVIGTNPTVLVGETAYLWAHVLPGDIWNGISLDILYSDVSAGEMYNPYAGPYPPDQRWNPGSDLNPVGDNHMFAVAVTEWGLGNVAEPLMAPGYNVDAHWLVAEMSFDNIADVYLMIGPQGYAGPGQETIYFGFDPWGNPDPGVGGPIPYPSVYADLHVVPEPAAVSLLLVCVLTVLARRRRGMM